VEEISQFGVVKGVKVGNRFGVYQHKLEIEDQFAKTGR
jgi:hypothetical protein